MDLFPNVFQLPMLPPTHEDSQTDYPYPAMFVPVQDEESLFLSFLDPLMVVPEEQVVHSPMYPSEWRVGHDSYDAPVGAC
jgi:hypothetical protein